MNWHHHHLPLVDRLPPQPVPGNPPRHTLPLHLQEELRIQNCILICHHNLNHTLNPTPLLPLPLERQRTLPRCQNPASRLLSVHSHHLVPPPHPFSHPPPIPLLRLQICPAVPPLTPPILSFVAVAVSVVSSASILLLPPLPPLLLLPSLPPPLSPWRIISCST